MFIRHLLLFVRLLLLALGMLVVLAFAPPSEAAFPGANGRLSITSDVDCDQGLFNVVTLDPYAYDSVPTGGDFDAIGRGERAWAPDGQRIAFEDPGDLATVNVDGTSYQPVGNGYLPAWSPDGQRIAYQKLDGDIHVMNEDGSGDVTLTSDPSIDGAAAWSPDGSKIAFTSDRDGNFEIYVMDVDGGNQTRLTTNPGFDYAPNWSPDGSKIAFERDSQILVMNANGSGEAVIPTLPAGGRDPAWSPDGSGSRSRRIWACTP